MVSTAQNTILCTACDPSCDTCMGFSTNCTSCYSPNFLTDQATCLPNCSYDSNHLNYYGNTTYRTCMECPMNCSRCFNYTGCTTCQNVNASLTMYNNEGICVFTCPSNSINSTSLQQCYECTWNCATCN